MRLPICISCSILHELSAILDNYSLVVLADLLPEEIVHGRVPLPGRGTGTTYACRTVRLYHSANSEPIVAVGVDDGARAVRGGPQVERGVRARRKERS